MDSKAHVKRFGVTWCFRQIASQRASKRLVDRKNFNRDLFLDLDSSMQTMSSQYLGDHDDEKQTNLNASIRERLRSKVRGKKVRN